MDIKRYEHHHCSYHRPKFNCGKYVYSGYDYSLIFSIAESTPGAFGISVDRAGDYNKDEYDDIVVGNYNINNTGKVYVYSGAPGHALLAGIDSPRGNVGSADVRFSISVAGVGDFNGDGYDDIMVGDYYDDTSGGNAGKVYIFSGANNSVIFSVNGPGDAYCIGSSVAGWFDFNHDGYLDIAYGASEYNNNIRGGLTIYSGNPSDHSQLFYTTGINFHEFLGLTVESAGDFNGDGYGDIITGWGHTFNGGTYQGRVTVYSGLDSSVLFDHTGENDNDKYYYVAGVGDVNGDGHDDIAVGAAGYNNNTGRVYIYSGMTGNLIATIDGEASSSSFGSSLKGFDIDNDGRSELIIGAYTYNNTGKVYIYKY